MYKLEILQIAKADLKGIKLYMESKLNNTMLYNKLLSDIDKNFKIIQTFPYSCPIYYFDGFKKRDFRSFKVKNYIIFYTILTENNTIVIVRILHYKMNALDVVNSYYRF